MPAPLSSPIPLSHSPFPSHRVKGLCLELLIQSLISESESCMWRPVTGARENRAWQKVARGRRESRATPYLASAMRDLYLKSHSRISVRTSKIVCRS